MRDMPPNAGREESELYVYADCANHVDGAEAVNVSPVYLQALLRPRTRMRLKLEHREAEGW